MPSFKNLIITSLLCTLLIPVSYAQKNEGQCCDKMGGVSYCDSSAGRLVCNNGFYSTCYCTPHAVMDLQLLRGCCLWKGGVLNSGLQSTPGVVLCNDGSVSEECSLENPAQSVAAW